jgi:hypothetical protein
LNPLVTMMSVLSVAVRHSEIVEVDVDVGTQRSVVLLGVEVGPFRLAKKNSHSLVCKEI